MKEIIDLEKLMLNQYLSIDMELINLESCFIDMLCRPINVPQTIQTAVIL